MNPCEQAMILPPVLILYVETESLTYETWNHWVVIGQHSLVFFLPILQYESPNSLHEPPPATF